MISKFMKRALATAGFCAAALGATTSANALTFVLKDVTVGGMTPAQLAAFNAAANIWTSRLTDNVTVYLTLDFTNQGNNGILGSTGSDYAVQSYAAVRSALTADRTSAADVSAVSNLQAGNYLAFQATNLDGTTRFDNDTNACVASGIQTTACGNNNQFLALTSANAKALGFATANNAATPDGEITFNGFYASQFDFDRSDGIGATQYDFVSIAAHEIGHALGFVSGVDDVDYCSPFSAGRCGPNFANAYAFDKYAIFSPLDLFRYSAPGVLDFRVGGSPFFSIDGGATSIEGFSNGSFNGSDRYQASHFRPGPQNLMNPYGFRGVAVNPTAKDLLAFDVMGWNLAGAVPEAPTWGMMILGFGLVGGAMRRKAKATLATA
jgi:hypothetical protein